MYNDPTQPRHAKWPDKLNVKYIEGQALTTKRADAIAEAARGRVLDLGCAGGIISILMARRGCVVTGIDFLSGQISCAQSLKEQEPREVTDRLTFVVGHVDATELSPDSFDTVVIGQLLEHVIYPREVLEEAKRVLKPGGIVLITVPIGYNRFGNHIRWFSVEIFRSLISDYFRIDDLVIFDGKQMMITATKNRSD